MKRRNKNKTFDCLGCGKDTMEKDYYMVTMEVWNEFGLGGSSWVNPNNHNEGWRSDSEVGSGMLCIGCLEGRMGRELTLDDLPDWPINWSYRRSINEKNQAKKAEQAED